LSVTSSINLPCKGAHFHTFTLHVCHHYAIILSATTPAMAFVVELLVLELVNHFYIGRNLFPVVRSSTCASLAPGATHTIKKGIADEGHCRRSSRCHLYVPVCMTTDGI
jgi:hypothetical protein